MKREIVQSATQATLGTISEPGNGDISKLSREQCNAVVAFLAHHNALPPTCSPIPMDVLRRITGRSLPAAATASQAMHVAARFASADHAGVCIDMPAPRVAVQSRAVHSHVQKRDVLFVVEVLAAHGIDRRVIDSIAFDLSSGRRRGYSGVPEVATDAGYAGCKPMADRSAAACELQGEKLTDSVDDGCTHGAAKKRQKVHADEDDASADVRS